MPVTVLWASDVVCKHRNDMHLSNKCFLYRPEFISSHVRIQILVVSAPEMANDQAISSHS